MHLTFVFLNNPDTVHMAEMSLNSHVFQVFKPMVAYPLAQSTLTEVRRHETAINYRFFINIYPLNASIGHQNING